MTRRRSSEHFMIFALVALAWASGPAVALAEEPETTVYKFEDEIVGGDGVQPLGEILQVRGRMPRESLIRVRTQFIAELYKSVERL